MSHSELLHDCVARHEEDEEDYGMSLPSEACVVEWKDGESYKNYMLDVCGFKKQKGRSSCGFYIL